MTPIQQLFLGTGSAVATKTYVDDVFSTQAYIGNASNRSFVNGLDLATEGGLVWNKCRSGSSAMLHLLYDTERGVTKDLTTQSSAAEGTSTTMVTAFNTNGYSIGTSGYVNENNSSFASWSFRKAKGFFDVVKISLSSYSTNQRISHSLGCIPGLILIKNTNNTEDWRVYHRDLGRNKYITLNESYSANSSTNAWGTVDATSTDFGFNTTNLSAGMPSTYIAYVFAGGESTQNEAVSVDFDGSNDDLRVANSSDFSFGSGDFTVEGWFKLNQMSSQNGIVNVWGHQNNRRSWVIQTDPASEGGALEFFVNSGGGTGTNHRTAGGTLSVGQWFHFAGVRDGNTLKLFLNGNLVDSTSYSSSLYNNTNDSLVIGSINGAVYADALISNIRVTKGQAIYTSSFKVSTEPLTTTSQGATASNVKLLCCNNSSVTGSTVTPGTITNNGSTASSDSPFDDPAAFTFGDSEEGVIKVGSYVGSGSTGLEVNLGWEPQFLMVKASSFANEHWHMFDNMRGIVSAGNDKWFYPNLSNAEPTAAERIDLTSTGFKIQTDRDELNKDGETFIWMALRRPDGYVGKPPELGTDVFNVDVAESDTNKPVFDSNFPVDFAVLRKPAVAEDWMASARLMQGRYFPGLNSSAQDYAWAGMEFDFNDGWMSDTAYNNPYMSWQWKRHAGFDVLAYKGTGTTQHLNHSLNNTPEMVWFKRRSATQNWGAYHKGLNSGSNPEDYYLVLNETSAETGGSSNTDKPLASAPTSTHIDVLGSSSFSNSNGSDYIAMLFASVDGISKVGSYSGNGSTGQTISTGFAPRFVIIRKYNDAAHWLVLDTTRGWGSGDDKYLLLNSSGAQGDYEVGAPTSNGFTLVGDNDYNNSSGEYIYYAHA